MKKIIYKNFPNRKAAIKFADELIATKQSRWSNSNKTSTEAIECGEECLVTLFVYNKHKMTYTAQGKKSIEEFNRYQEEECFDGCINIVDMQNYCSNLYELY